MSENERGDILGRYDLDGVVCLLKVKHFEGPTMHIDPKFLQIAFHHLKSLDKGAYDVQIGIRNSASGGGFYIFLDKEREIAIGVAGRIEQTEEKEK